MRIAQKNHCKADTYQLFGEKPSGRFIFPGKQAGNSSFPFIGHESTVLNSGIIYNKSAFKHGLTKADIEWAFLHPIRNGILPDYENKYLLVGFDTLGNAVEIMYNRIDNERVNVFHAMKCRKVFLPCDINNLE